ncbi:hypothetical protein [Azospirillum isscasi]|uniref:Uncharacterized protein n=1 Tax=Azospirillum isscasi TaxID=3053926 RepID=A0ABU0WF08_9PROT|nr:hypothetical protein [Azospirillum isscasi]MDQ2102783.1 hypothetical protein [Azospirillum isscasi]
MRKLKADEMTCGHCARTATTAVVAVRGAEPTLADLKAGRVAIGDAWYDVGKTA